MTHIFCAYLLVARLASFNLLNFCLRFSHAFPLLGFKVTPFDRSHTLG